MTSRTEAQRAAALELLLDKAELQELAVRYGRAVDRGDRGLLLSLYHDDAIDHHGSDFRGSPVEFADYVKGTAANLEVSAHYMLNASYAIEGDVADGEIYFIAYHRTRPPASNEIIVSGRYLDRYERRAGVWKIAHRHLVWDWADNKVMPPQVLQFLRDRGEGAGTGEDCSYQLLPLLAKQSAAAKKL
jgi:hypothetical protein